MPWIIFALAITFLAQAPDRASRAVPDFPPETAALLESLDPEYRITLRTLHQPAVQRLVNALQRARPTRAGMPIWVWLLANGDADANGYGHSVVYELSLPEHAMRLPFGELAAMLAGAEPDRKALIAELLRNVLGHPKLRITRADRDRLVPALIESLDVPHADLRTWAVEALGQLHATEAVDAVVRVLEDPDNGYHQITRVHGLAAIGAPRGAAALERIARSSGPQEVRDAAAVAFVNLTKPRDPGAAVRRLLWEQPDTALERRVLAQGTTALPAVWEALAAGPPGDRRAAAALLGWFRDVRSIDHILKAIDANHEPEIRDQLLFDLNMILLTEAPAAPPQDRKALAGLYVRWLHQQLLAPRVGVRNEILKQKTVHILPDRIDPPFSVDLGAAAAVISPSREAFFAAVEKKGFGVAFHAITASNGVARVATTLFLPGSGMVSQVWISLYRHNGTAWTPLPVPEHPLLRRYRSEPSLMPVVTRNYGPDHPLKILRLDLAMERIRVEGEVVEFLPDENAEYPLASRDLDTSYVRLLERYKRSDAPAVKYSAELYSARLTGQPNLQLWIDALSQPAGGRIRTFATRVLADYFTPRFRDNGRELAGGDRADLTAVALKTAASLDPRLSEGRAPRPENIKSVRQWERFSLVALAFGSAPLGQTGYSMLFERRGNDWAFLCLVSTWIS